MTETYSPKQTRQRDAVRALIADTNVDGFYLVDEEIDAAIARAGSGNGVILEAAAECARTLAFRFAQAAVTATTPGGTAQRDRRADLYAQLAKTLDEKAASIPEVSVIDWSDPDIQDIEVEIGRTGEVFDVS